MASGENYEVFFLFFQFTKPPPSSGLIGTGDVCVLWNKGTDRIGAEKIAKERKEDRSACMSCARSEIKEIKRPDIA